MAAQYRRNPLAPFDLGLSDEARLALWHELFFPTFLEALPSIEPPSDAHARISIVFAAWTYRAPAPLIHPAPVILLPDCGLAREYLMFSRHYNHLHPGVAAE
eukprot:7017570-Alexandrium_andersonii.AAC.1